MYRLKLNRLIRKNKISYVVFGHSHKVEMVQYDKFLAINPGSLTAPENEGQGTYAIGL
jgi:predicted phosphodiesterase